jgi:hypothetical protein
MLCYVSLYHVMICYVMSVMSIYVMLCYIMPRYTTLFTRLFGKMHDDLACSRETQRHLDSFTDSFK